MSKTSNEIKFLFKHSSIYGLGTIIGQVVAFAMLPLYTRYLTPEDYGILELLNVTATLIGIVISIGVTAAMSRYYFNFTMEGERKRVISTTYISAFIILPIVLLILSNFTEFFGQLIFHSSYYSSYFMVSFMTLAFGIILDIGLVYLRILQKSTLYISITLARLIMLITLNIFFIVYLGYGVMGILYSSLVTMLFSTLIVTILILYKVRFGFSWLLAKDMFKYSIPLIPASVATSLVNYSDRYFIRYFVSIADAGIYGLANKIGTSIHMLITSPFILTFLPRRFEIVKQSNAREIFKSVFNYYFLIILFVGLTVSIFADEIMLVMTTQEFYRAGALVPVIVLSMIVFGMKYHFEFGILHSGKTIYYSYINIFTSIVHIGLNIFLIKSYGLWGALYSSIIAILLNTTLIYLVSSRLYKIDFDFIKNCKGLVVAFIIFFMSRYYPEGSLIIRILFKLALLAIFPWLLFRLRVLSNYEISKGKEIFSRFRLLLCKS